MNNIQNYEDLFSYKAIYSKKRKRTCSIKIDNGIAVISLPIKFSQKELIKLLEEKKYWIINHITKAKKTRNLIEDGKILLLGDELSLIIKESALLKKCNIEKINNKIIINTPKNSSQENIEKTIIDWYKIEFKKIIEERVKIFAQKYDFKYRNIRIGSQKTVWGTCDVKNNLCFNYKAIIFNIEIIDYLVIHELSHTVHKNHSDKFWNLVESILPEYKKLKAKMKIITW